MCSLRKCVLKGILILTGGISIVIRKISFITILAVIVFTGIGCQFANPTMEDVDRVKKQFLVIRFNSTFDPELKNLNDRQLFELSCQYNRVRCDRVLNLLKKNDTEFYSRLISDK